MRWSGAKQRRQTQQQSIIMDSFLPGVSSLPASFPDPEHAGIANESSVANRTSILSMG